MDEGPLFRPLHEEDLPAVGGLGLPGAGRLAAAELDRGDDVDVLVTEVGGRLVAVGAVDHVARSGAGVLFLLLVHPDHRSRGVGTALVRARERCAHRRGAGVTEIEVDVGNDRALALYGRLDYRRVDVVRAPDGVRRVLRRTAPPDVPPPG